MNRSPLNLHETLANVRPMPETIFPAIEARLQRNRRRARLVWSLAAMLVLSIGAISVTEIVVNRAPSVTPVVATTVIDQDVAEELQASCDFANGNDIDAELAEYRLNDE
jgi:hypothetical protein